MADNVIAASLKLDSKDANQSVKSFKTELREANESLISVQSTFGATSKEAIEAAKRVADLKDRMQEAREVSDLFDPGAKFQVFGNVVRTVAGGMTALTGSMALFGEESEDVQKALLKVQGALAITEGLNTIADSAKDFTRLRDIIVQTSGVQKVYAASTALTSTAMKGLGVSTATTTTGFKVLRGALIATGIGALAVGVGLLIQNFDKVKIVIEKLIGPLKGITDFIGGLVEKMTDFAGITSKNERNLEKLTKSVNSANNEFDRQIKLLEAQGGQEEKIAKLQKGKLANEEQLLRNKAKIKQLTEEEQKQLKDFALEREIIDIREHKRVLAQAKERQEKLKEEQEKRREAEKKRIEEARKRAEELKKITLDTSNFEAGTAAIDLDRVKKENDVRRELTLGAIHSDFERKMTLQAELDMELGSYTRTQYENQQVELELWYQKKYELAHKDGLDTTRLTEEYERQKTLLTKSENERRLSLMSNILGQAATLFGKHTAAGKTMAIAQATIDTYQSAVAAYKAGLSAGGPLGLALGPISAGLAVAAGLKNIREITKVKAPGGAGGSVPSISVDAPLQPRRPVETNTRLPQDQINQIGNATVKAFVVETDVTNNQEKITRLNRAARLGG